MSGWLQTTRARVGACAVMALLLLEVALTNHAMAASSLQSRFDYVAVFPAQTDPAAIEGWRQRVLGKVHQRACLRQMPCITRMLRLALPGQFATEVIGFDLMPDIAPEERAAIVAASSHVIAGTRLLANQRPADLYALSAADAAP